MSRRTVREKVVQALYECDFHPDNVEEVIASRGGKLNEEDRSFYLRLAHGIRQHAAGADAIITRFLKKGWSVGRLSSVDRTILRMAVYELLFEDTPKAAVLNEAVELGKAFGGPESGRFINGVLGSVVANLEQIKQEQKQIQES
ncbi:MULTISPECIES: transcription antitermination factor NusB [Thermoactinomyces]|jgi:transcription antitermination protein NusB|uniref:Transcription antitermination protein NusB n=1 Tax=Thermoactinomyces daqus TaxID=1329516 RepID=A0A7W1XA67_9BACL|nr:MULTISPECIES: transcription antitermination factor NusB [Thermoactinomyces]MBA4542973.1 transcription antitermination factor NusB [Thermoactinomyces daqus]MBH8596745.1 transcription antitermination factor NusB [Thermoactinomyces sp. CICC 10523]MBH8603507.1 transcription antitermination factor NusB [Thermoactinomyces sp. CICC 10522]MBH8606671.1 transcription antitermination factor NusB [Thermoactinomyces sp. CICC 10521]